MDTQAPVTEFKIEMKLGAHSGITAEAQVNREIMVNVYNAIAAGDNGALAAYLDPEVHFVEAASLPYGVDAYGIEATLAGVNGMFGAWSKITCEIEEVLTAGDLVCLYMTFHGISRATGKIYHAVCAEMFRFKNKKIIEWRPVYWDTHAVRVTCGLA